jgi:hypothetical protein
MSYSSATEILPGLWMGDTTSAHDTKFLNDKHIEFIINCSNEISYPKNSEIKVKYHFKPKPQDYIRSLDEYVTLINTNINSYNILIYGGPILTVAYIMKYGTIELSRVIEAIETKRIGVKHDMDAYVAILKVYQKLLSYAKEHPQ